MPASFSLSGVGRYGSCDVQRDCEPFHGAGKISREWGPPASFRPERGGANKNFSVQEQENWKKEETEFIQQHDTQEADTWFIIDKEWLDAWKAFVKSNKEHPGPIDNKRLIDDISGQPKPGFKLREHYRGVNSEVWNFWFGRYGGGPVIQRKKLDLYAAAPPQELDETMTVRRSSARRPAADLDETLVVRRPPARQNLGALAMGSAEESLPEDRHHRRAASVRHGRTPGLQDDPPADRRGSRGSISSSQASRGSPSRSRVAASKPPSTSPPSVATESGSSGPSRRGLSLPAAGRGSKKRTGNTVKCDKCDGPHETELCPHFNRPRERHKDAWSMLGKAGKVGESEEDVPLVKNARVVTQPGDGSCLFHSLSYGLSGRSHGQSLRREICDFIAKNPDLEIGDNALKDWINYDGGGNVQSYARSMAGTSWGGGIEMAAFSKMKCANVHVYEKSGGGYRRISAFKCPHAKKTVSVLYGGRAHYDALVVP